MSTGRSTMSASTARRLVFVGTLVVLAAITVIAFMSRSPERESSSAPVFAGANTDAPPREESVRSFPEPAASIPVRTHDDKCELIVRTRNVWKRALPAIEIFSTDRGERVRLGTSDDHGELRALVASNRPVQIEGIADGYLPASLAIEAPCGQTVQLLLAGDAGISGRVERADGFAVQDAQVFCWPSETRPSPDAIYARRASEHRLHVVDTGRDGQFEVVGLDPRVPYTLVAGANGLAPHEWLLGVRPSNVEQRIVLWTVYGLSTRLVSSEGGPPRTSWRLARSLKLGQLEEGKAARVLPKSLDFQLAGLSPKTTEESKAFDGFLGVKAAASFPEFGPISISFALPGYEPVRADVRLPRVDVALTEQAISLQPTAAGWGSLSVDLISATLDESQNEREDAWAALVFERDAGEASRIALSSLLDRQVIDGIPFGDYRVHLEVGRLYRSPTDGSALSLRIDAAQETATFDLSDAGAVDVTIDAPNGVDPGPLTVYLVSAARNVRQPFTFASPPYRLHAVPPGRYQVQVQRLPMGIWPARESDEFDVGSSQLTNVEVSWAERN